MVEKFNGNKIRQLRQLKGWSADDLSNQAGVSTPYIYKIENGEGNPSLTVLNKIANALDVDVSEIVGVNGSDFLKPFIEIRPVERNKLFAYSDVVKETAATRVEPSFRNQTLMFLKRRLTDKSLNMYKSLASMSDGEAIEITFNNGLMTLSADDELRDAILMLYSVFISDRTNYSNETLSDYNKNND